MLKLSLKYGATLIGIYLVAVNATKVGTLVKEGANGAVSIGKTLQGR